MLTAQELAVTWSSGGEKIVLYIVRFAHSLLSVVVVAVAVVVYPLSSY